MPTQKSMTVCYSAFSDKKSDYSWTCTPSSLQSDFLYSRIYQKLTICYTNNTYYYLIRNLLFKSNNNHP